MALPTGASRDERAGSRRGVEILRSGRGKNPAGAGAFHAKSFVVALIALARAVLYS